jgi:WSC domain
MSAANMTMIVLFQGFFYAGTQNGTMCSCGNSYGSLGTSYACNVNCSGDSKRACGGVSANIVINTGLSKNLVIELLNPEVSFFCAFNFISRAAVTRKLG